MSSSAESNFLKRIILYFNKTERTDMGKTTVKLQRFLSTPVSLEIKHCAIPLCCDKGLTQDGDNITYGDNDFKSQPKSNLSSGTIEHALPCITDYELCTSDPVKTYKSYLIRHSVISTMKNIVAGSMPVLATRRRRCAVPDIYHNIRREDLEHIFAIFDTEAGLETDLSDSKLKKRRPALADIFHDVTQEDMAHILSIFGDRLCENDFEMSDDIDEPNDYLTRRTRRHGMANIFEGIEQDEKQRILSANLSALEDDSSDEETENTCVFNRTKRRGALADIYHDMSSEDVQTLIENSDCDALLDVVNMNEFNEQNGSLRRRDAVADIFQDISEADVQRLERVYDRLCCEGVIAERGGEVGTSGDSIRPRRAALADIFQDIDSVEIQNLLSAYE